jgi:hypothetical protein
MTANLLLIQGALAGKPGLGRADPGVPFRASHDPTQAANTRT